MATGPFKWTFVLDGVDEGIASFRRLSQAAAREGQSAGANLDRGLQAGFRSVEAGAGQTGRRIGEAVAGGAAQGLGGLGNSITIEVNKATLNAPQAGEGLGAGLAQGAGRGIASGLPPAVIGAVQAATGVAQQGGVQLGQSLAGGVQRPVQLALPLAVEAGTRAAQGAARAASAGLGEAVVGGSGRTITSGLQGAIEGGFSGSTQSGRQAGRLLGVGFSGEFEGETARAIPSALSRALEEADAVPAGQRIGTDLSQGLTGQVGNMVPAGLSNALEVAANIGTGQGQSIGSRVSEGFGAVTESVIPASIDAALAGAESSGAAAGSGVGAAAGEGVKQGIASQGELFLEVIEQAKEAATQAGIAFNAIDLRFETIDGQILPPETVQEMARLNGQLGQAVEGLQQFAQAAGGARGQLGQLAGSTTQLTEGMLIMEGIVSGVALSITNRLQQAVLGLGQSITTVIGQFSEYDGIIREALASTEEGVAGYDKLRKVLDRVAVIAAGTPPQVAELSVELARAGFTIDEVDVALEGIVHGAEATSTSFAQMGSIVANALRAFGLETAKTQEVVDLFVATANASNQSVTDLGQAFTYAAPTAKTLGIPMSDLAATLGLMANSGLKASIAGNGLREGLNRLQQAAGGASGEALGLTVGQERLGIAMQQLGADVTNANGDLLSMDEVLIRLKQSMDGFETTQRVELTKAIFGSEAGSKFLSLLNQSEEDIRKMFNTVRNSEGATDTARAAMDSWKLSMQQLTGAIESIQNSLGGAFAAALLPAVKAGGELLELFGQLPKPIQDLITKFAVLTVAVGAATAAVVLWKAAMDVAIFDRYAKKVALFGGLLRDNLGEVLRAVTARMRLLNVQIIRFGANSGKANLAVLLRGLTKVKVAAIAFGKAMLAATVATLKFAAGAVVKTGVVLLGLTKTLIAAGAAAAKWGLAVAAGGAKAAVGLLAAAKAAGALAIVSGIGAVAVAVGAVVAAIALLRNEQEKAAKSAEMAKIAQESEADAIQDLKERVDALAEAYKKAREEKEGLATPTAGPKLQFDPERTGGRPTSQDYETSNKAFGESRVIQEAMERLMGELQGQTGWDGDLNRLPIEDLRKFYSLFADGTDVIDNQVDVLTRLRDAAFAAGNFSQAQGYNRWIERLQGVRDSATEVNRALLEQTDLGPELERLGVTAADTGKSFKQLKDEVTGAFNQESVEILEAQAAGHLSAGEAAQQRADAEVDAAQRRVNLTTAEIKVLEGQEGKEKRLKELGGELLEQRAELAQASLRAADARRQAAEAAVEAALTEVQAEQQVAEARREAQGAAVGAAVGLGSAQLEYARALQEAEVSRLELQEQIGGRAVRYAQADLALAQARGGSTRLIADLEGQIGRMTGNRKDSEKAITEAKVRGALRALALERQLFELKQLQQRIEAEGAVASASGALQVARIKAQAIARDERASAAQRATAEAGVQAAAIELEVAQRKFGVLGLVQQVERDSAILQEQAALNGLRKEAAEAKVLDRLRGQLGAYGQVSAAQQGQAEGAQRVVGTIEAGGQQVQLLGQQLGGIAGQFGDMAEGAEGIARGLDVAKGEAGGVANALVEGAQQATVDWGQQTAAVGDALAQIGQGVELGGLTTQMQTLAGESGNTASAVGQTSGALSSMASSGASSLEQIAQGFRTARGEAVELGNVIAQIGGLTAGRWMGGPVEAGWSGPVNELGQEAFLSTSGSLNLIRAAQSSVWTAPQAGTVIPAGLTAQMQELGMFDRQQRYHQGAPVAVRPAPAAAGGRSEVVDRQMARLARQIGRLGAEVSRMSQKEWRVMVSQPSRAARPLGAAGLW